MIAVEENTRHSDTAVDSPPSVEHEDKEDKGCVVFCELKGLKLQPDHLDEALGLFERECGGAPAVLGIADHKDNAAIIAEARGRGFTVIHDIGPLAFEIWLYRKPPDDGKCEIEEARGFFCKGCLEDREEEAGNGYCKECLCIVEAGQRALGPKDFWSDDCLIYFHFGLGYPLTNELHTIKLGAEADVQEALSIGCMPDSITGDARKVLAEILEDRRESGYGVRETGLVGAGDNGASGGKQKATGHSTPGKRLALRASKQKNKALLRR